MSIKLPQIFLCIQERRVCFLQGDMQETPAFHLHRQRQRIEKGATLWQGLSAQLLGVPNLKIKKSNAGIKK
ncbi:hypothetical protein AMECASPLE_036814 [Ameca splendens]|uniref:Uncharacterized protein n=1 Tax=Ameca splendens TaxID=208324 RepID=A0ABV0Z600_9TELE